MSDEKSWESQKGLITHQIKELRDEVKEVRDQVIQLRIDQTVLKFKSGVWGAIGSSVPVLLTMSYLALSGKLG